MRFCQYCGKEIDDNAAICPCCGRQVQEIKPVLPNKEESPALAIVALIFGIIGGWIGFICGIIGLTKYKKGMNRNMCIAAICLFVIWIIIFISIAAK